MGRLSLQQLVYSIDKAIENQQLEAREKISEVVRRAKKEDPIFFEIPYNPFNPENEVDSDEEEEEEDEKAMKWFSGLKSSTSPTAKEILRIRKELYKKVQILLDEFKQSSPICSITPTSIFASLYCRLLQLENIV